MTAREILAADVKLGDRVQTFDGDYATSTVVRIDRNAVYLFRPYVHVDGVICGGNGALYLTPYIGSETYPIMLTDRRPLTLLYRDETLLR